MPQQHKHELRVSELEQRLRQDPGLPVKAPTSSYWQIPAVDFASTPLPEKVDVAIIGSGITGCSCAKRLLESNDSIRVAVLEARNICSGATGRNGGHIKAVPEHTYADNIATQGLERTREIIHFTLANVEALLSLVPTLPVKLQHDCEVRRVHSLNLFTDLSVFEQFKGLIEVFEKDNPDLKGRGRLVSIDELRSKAGVHNAVGGYMSSAGAAWPYRLISGIFSVMLENFRSRFSVHARSPVESIDVGEEAYYISTPEGAIRAKTIVHATNGHAGHLLPGIRGSLFPSGQTGDIFHGGGLAQSIQRGLGELGNIRDDENSVQAVAHLGGALNATFGIEEDQRVASETKAAWTGVMGFTSDGLPLVGRLPAEATQRDGCGEWIAAGFNGYGMANAWLCGQHVADGILGKEEVQPVPQAYKISVERLQGMSASVAANHWLAAMGMD